MPGLFSKVFKKEAPKKDQNSLPPEPEKPRWDDAWQRAEIAPEEVQELLRGCTREIKSRALETPFLLLPFRPASDPSAARTFIRNFFGPGLGNDPPMGGQRLATELRLAEPLVLCSVMKWCWSRLPGGVVTWDAYELFKMGETDANFARDAFSTFIPISTANDARTKIITDFFDLMAAVAAHSKSNGFPPHKLSRFAGWWTFEQKSHENGFDGGYKSWVAAADATSHLFFAYLRSLAPDPVQGALTLPRSLQQLLEQTTDYPPRPDTSLHSQIQKVVMIVDSVSPTPFALLRRAKNFEYRSDDEILQAFAECDDPLRAITDECTRILQGIATANDSSNSKLSTSLRDASWSRFEDIGFSDTNDGADVKSGIFTESALTKKRSQRFEGLQSVPSSTVDLGRPTTPSWADFLSSGFNEQGGAGPGSGSTSLLPPDKKLPPLSIRGTSSYSDRQRPADAESQLGGGELASVKPVALDDVFWWVWITSLSGEETVSRKSTFGRCALIETKLLGGSWLLFEEVVKGAKAEPANVGYVAEKKSRFGFRKMSMKKVLKNTPTKSSAAASNGSANGTPSPTARKSIAPDQHARIQAAAAALSQKKASSGVSSPERRGRLDADAQSRTASVFTLQPVILNEAAPAMKWANSYDKNEVRAQYLGNKFAGRGSAVDLPSAENKSGANSFVSRDQRVETPAASSISTPAKPPTLDTSTPARKPVQSSIASPKTPQPQQGEKSTPQRPQIGVSPPTRGSSHGKTDGLISGPEYGKQAGAATQDVQASSPTQASPIGSGKVGKKLPGRLGSVFGKKKPEGEKSPPRQPPTRVLSNSSAAGGSAVAAAKAALEAKSHQESPPAPRQQVTAKRTSLITDNVNKSEPEQAKTPYQQAAAAAAVVLTPTAEPSVGPHNLYPEKTYEPSYTTDSHIDEAENRDAEREFSKFDQGSVHEGSVLHEPTYEHKNASVSDVTDDPTDDSSRIGHESQGVSAESSGERLEAPSTDEVAQAIEAQAPARARALSDERWAQIRKNAAERVAARQSEETSHKTLNTEDDGETSGEETIESRVARIKARVAELTGNMDVPNHSQSQADH